MAARNSNPGPTQRYHGSRHKQGCRLADRSQVSLFRATCAVSYRTAGGPEEPHGPTARGAPTAFVTHTSQNRRGYWPSSVNVRRDRCTTRIDHSDRCFSQQQSDEERIVEFFQSARQIDVASLPVVSRGRARAASSGRQPSFGHRLGATSDVKPAGRLRRTTCRLAMCFKRRTRSWRICTAKAC
jgi:hypothetical protein